MSIWPKNIFNFTKSENFNQEKIKPDPSFPIPGGKIPPPVFEQLPIGTQKQTPVTVWGEISRVTKLKVNNERTNANISNRI